MSEAFYYKGFAIEYDTAAPRLAIDGQLTQVRQTADGFETSELPNLQKRTLLQLAETVIEHSSAFERRERLNKEHLRILQQGVEHWNQWRKSNPEIRPILYDAPLNDSRDLSMVNFSNANLIGAQLPKAILVGANFHEANLLGANLHDADLTGANFCRTDLYKTDLSMANLTAANLQGTQLAMTNFKGATLIGCKVYGMSAWDLKLDKATRQEGLIIRYRYQGEGEHAEGNEGQITVDDLQVAQFVYLLLNNENIRSVIDTIGQKGVLILGRFTPERKPLLDAIREKLRKLEYVPMMFDFEKPTQRDFTETIKTLAGISRFIIADITNPRSSPLELQATVPDYMIPFVPIIQADELPFPMFQDLQQKYGEWVLPLLEYDSTENLLRVFEKAVIEPALELSQKLLTKKSVRVPPRRVSEY